MKYIVDITYKAVDKKTKKKKQENRKFNVVGSGKDEVVEWVYKQMEVLNVSKKNVVSVEVVEEELNG
jgi:predicted Ser/Thr protein kinase